MKENLTKFIDERKIFLIIIMNKIIITGTSRGIGNAIAKNLLKQNVTVIGISRKHTIKHKNYFAISFDLMISKILKIF